MRVVGTPGELLSYRPESCSPMISVWCSILRWTITFVVAGQVILAGYVLYTMIYGDTVTSCVGGQCNVWESPPSRRNYSATARYMMHISEWGTLSTISTWQSMEGYPFGNVFSVSDGPTHQGTGVPYFYLTELDLSVMDLNMNAAASLSLSEGQSDYCYKKNYDAQDPRCAHAIFTGSIVRLEAGSPEESFAREALFSRHPAMVTWPQSHGWFFAKLEIRHIFVLDHFGGAAEVPIDDYYMNSS